MQKLKSRRVHAGSWWQRRRAGRESVHLWGWLCWQHFLGITATQHDFVSWRLSSPPFYRSVSGGSRPFPHHCGLPDTHPTSGVRRPFLKGPWKALANQVPLQGREVRDMLTLRTQTQNRPLQSWPKRRAWASPGGLLCDLCLASRPSRSSATLSLSAAHTTAVYTVCWLHKAQKPSQLTSAHLLSGACPS